MFVLTGDVHDMSLRVQDQFLLPSGESEVKISRKFLQLANRHDIVPTLYITGAAAAQESEDVRALLAAHRFELGGHTYGCTRQRLFFAASRYIFRVANGPWVVQRNDMRKAIHALSALSGRTIVSWRNHAYRQDRNTLTLAASHGLRGVSNVVRIGAAPSRHATGAGTVAILPINTLPDHENIHPDGRGQSPSVAGIEEWAEAVAAQVERNEATGVPSVILAHPACMEVEDGMKALEVLLNHLRGLPSMTMAELAEATLSHGAGRQPGAGPADLQA